MSNTRPQNASKRGTVIKADSGGKRQTLQVAGFADEVFEGAEHFQPYGLSAHPKRIEASKGAECVLLALGGTQDRLVAIAVDDRRYRPVDQPEGEVALYSFRDDPGKNAQEATHRITLAADGSIVLKAGSSSITLAADGSITLAGTAITIEGTDVAINAGSFSVSADSVVIDSPNIDLAP